jgi:hypothetical protein
MFKRLLRKALFVFGGLLTGLGIGEAALRLVGFSRPQLMQMDSERGWSFRPGAQGWVEGEGRAYVSINSAGLRDREHAVPKPPKTLRVAVLGDSYAAAENVDASEAFWAVLERELSSGVRGYKVEVLNFGVDGYGTAQEFLTLKREVWKYSPDLVLLAFLPSNDVSDNSLVLCQDPDRPYFLLKNGRLELDDSFRQAPGFRMRQTLPFRAYHAITPHLRSLQLARSVRNWYRLRDVGNRLQGQSGELGLADEAFQEPPSTAWSDAWNVSEALIELMREETASHGAAFLLAILTRAVQVDPDERVVRHWLGRLGVSDPWYPETRLRRFAEREGIPVVALGPAFGAYARQHGTYLHGVGPTRGSGHWNSVGHELAGKTLAPEVSRLLHARISARQSDGVRGTL